MALPNFIIAGTAKAGTTSLYHYARQHPDVFMSNPKEPRFFSYGMEPEKYTHPREQWIMRQTVTSWKDYQMLFDGANDHTAVGEASIGYFYHPRAAERIADALPNVRIIIVLRQPAERAFSQYSSIAFAGLDPLSFQQALTQEQQRIDEGWSQAWHYAARGFYAKNLRRYLSLFGEDHVKIFLFEDIRDKPVETLRDVFSFIGVDPAVPIHVSERHNVTRAYRSQMVKRLLRSHHSFTKFFRRQCPRVHASLLAINTCHPQLSSRQKRALTERFEDDILETQEILGRDLSSWLS